jgi:glycosyltransferase involved in cell wall biosynthesis
VPPIHRPLISVVIPVYNRERYIVEAIESVRAQDYAPVEIIVVDDGSTDGTAAAVRGMGTDIRYLYQDNRGVAGARNAGVSAATGPFLAFLDSDDLWMPAKLTRQMAVFAANPETDAVYGHAEQFICPELDPAFKSRIRAHMGTMPAPVPPAMLIRRASFERVGRFDERLNVGVEIEWYARLSEKNLRVVMLPDTIYRRRLHRTNLNLERAGEQSERLHALKTVIDRRRRATQSS